MPKSSPAFSRGLIEALTGPPLSRHTPASSPAFSRGLIEALARYSRAAIVEDWSSPAFSRGLIEAIQLFVSYCSRPWGHPRHLAGASLKPDEGGEAGERFRVIPGI